MAKMGGLSFSFSKRAEPKRVVEALAKDKKSDDGRQAIVALEAGQVTVDGKQEAAKQLVIACKNPLDEAKRKSATSAAKAAAQTPAVSPDDMPAGLVTKKKLDGMSEEDAAAARELFKEAADSGDGTGEAADLGRKEVVPILMRAGSKRVRESGSSAPDATRDMYDTVSVESFGEAMLRGMGFDPEKHKTKPVWHDKPRDNLLGLGAKALLPHERAKVKGKGKGAAAGASSAASGASAAVSSTAPASSSQAAAEPVAEGGAAAPGSSSAADADAPPEKRQKVSSESATSNAQRKDVWPTRGLLVRIVGKAGQLRDFFGLEAVVLEADEASGCCRIKARKGDKSHVLQRVDVAELETRVSRACTAVRIVRGPQKGKNVNLVRRDVQRSIAVVALDGKETELPLDDVCQFMA